MDEHTEPPTTIKEVGIHIGYMRQDINDLKDLVRSQSGLYAPQRDLEELDKRVAKLEGRNNIKDTFLWVGLVASAIINILVIYQLFTGRK